MDHAPDEKIKLLLKQGQIMVAFDVFCKSRYSHVLEIEELIQAHAFFAIAGRDERLQTYWENHGEVRKL